MSPPVPPSPTMPGPTPDASTPDASTLVATLEWLFDRIAAAQSTTPTTEPGIDRLITAYAATAGATGFVTNLGGLFTLPLTLPANLVGVAALQLKLIAAIAAARGHDVHSDQVRTLGIACLTGGSAIELLKKAGIQVGERLGQRAIAGLSGVVLARINQLVGFQLVAKAGAAGMFNLTKVVPILGGLVGGGIDAASTKAVGEIAKRVFPKVLPPIPLPTQRPPDLLA